MKAKPAVKFDNMMRKKTYKKTKISIASTLKNSNNNNHQNDQFKVVVDQKSVENSVTPPPSPQRQRPNGVFGRHVKHFDFIQYHVEALPSGGTSASSTLTPPLTTLPTPPLTRIKSTPPLSPLPPTKTSSDKQHPNSVDEYQELNYKDWNCNSEMANLHPGHHQSTNSLGNSQGVLPVLPRGSQTFPTWSNRFLQQYQHHPNVKYERIMPCIWSCRICSFKCNSGNELVEHNQAYQHWNSNGHNLQDQDNASNIDTNSKEEDHEAFSTANSMDTGFLVETAQIINMGTSEVIEEMIYQQVEPQVHVSNYHAMYDFHDFGLT